MNNKTIDYYRFGPFRFSPAQNNLWRDDELVSLSPTALDVLAILLEKRPEPASRDELLDRVWKDTAVEEANVTVAISNIRKILSTNGTEETEFIKTIPKKGYLFVGEVEEVFEDLSKTETPDRLPAAVPGPSARPYLIAILIITVLFVTSFSVWLTWGDGSEISSVPIRHRKYKSVAVLPFKGIGKKNQPLSLGLADNLISRLGKINKFAVRPLSAVESFSEQGEDALAFARKLKVDAVVVGSLQQDGDQIRISVRLLDARDGAQLWDGTYDELENNIFELQDRLSLEVAKNLIAKLSTEENKALTEHETSNLDAFRAYNTGQFYASKRTRADIEKAIPFFEKAVRIDPGYASAYTAIAGSLLLLTDSTYGGSPSDVKRERIQGVIDKAIELDPQSASAYASRGFLLMAYDWDVKGALENYDRAIKLNPNDAITRNWKAWALIAQKRFEEADKEMRLAKSLDPTSRMIAAEAGLPLLFAGKLKEAEPLFREAVEMEKTFFQARFRMWYWLFLSGRHAESLNELDAMKQISSDKDPFYLGLLAITQASTNQKSNARAHFTALEKLAEQDQRVSPMLLASVAVALEDKEKANYWLEKAFVEKNDYLIYLEFAPEFGPLGKEPWFKELVERVNKEKQ